MGNVIDFVKAAAERKSISAQLDAEMRSRGGSGGEYTDVIWAIEDSLVALGWKVKTSCHDMPDMTTYVDYANKTIHVNNHKAFHTAKTLERIQENIQQHGLNEGHYVYSWVEGEAIPYEDGTTWDSLYLQVRPYSAERDDRPRTKHDSRLTRKLRGELASALGLSAGEDPCA